MHAKNLKRKSKQYFFSGIMFREVMVKDTGNCRGYRITSDAVFASLLLPTVWCHIYRNINKLIKSLKKQGLRNSTYFL